MKSNSPRNAWTEKEDAILRECYATPGMPFRKIVKVLKKEGFPRTVGAITNRVYALRQNGFILTTAGGVPMNTPKNQYKVKSKDKQNPGRHLLRSQAAKIKAKPGRVTSTMKTDAMPVAMTTGNVVIKHKMFTMTTTKDSITITVNS